MALAAAAAVAGVGALGAYLDGKYQLRRDAYIIHRMRRSERIAARAKAEGRLNVWYVFRNVVEKYPNAVCVWSRTGSYTFREVLDISCQYGNYFLSIGVKRGHLVAFYLQNSPEFVFAWLGLWSIGCGPAMINYNLTGAGLIHCLKLSGADVIVVDADAECTARIHDQRNEIENDLKMHPVFLDDSLKSHISSFPTAVSDRSLPRNMDGEFPSMLLYTSGTTGLPKGCAFTMNRMYTTIFQKDLRDREGSGGDRWYVCMPMYHGTASVCIIACILTGVSVAIAKKFSTNRFWKDIHDSKSTYFVYVGETARYLLAAPPSPLDRGHNVRCMYGNGLRPDVWEKFQERFGIPNVAEFFSSTEGLFTLINYDSGPYQSRCVGHHGAILRRLMHNVYIPVVIDPMTGDMYRDPKTGFATRAPYSEGGEIIISVPDESAFQGYWKNPDATAKKFVRDVFKKGDIYYRTGDALRRTEDGHWHFLDRLGDTFRWKSENVSTAEVATVLGEYPGVAEANVYGVSVPTHEGRAGCAAILIQPDQRANFGFAAFARYARERLPKYAVPVFLRLVEASNHTHNQKQNKVPLRDEGVDPDNLGSKAPEGKNDRFLWLLPQNDTYLEFGRSDWEDLVSGRVKL
ncbi:AMP dependent ligase [Histoplasma ohiense]|nr:AMP dependent ligase [Histoplasma ohiense (nom. inval.)]